jgi:hypothetical protein
LINCSRGSLGCRDYRAGDLSILRGAGSFLSQGIKSKSDGNHVNPAEVSSMYNISKFSLASYKPRGLSPLVSFVPIRNWRYVLRTKPPMKIIYIYILYFVMAVPALTLSI